MKNHLWQGDWIDDAELAERLSHIAEWAAGAAARALDTGALLTASEALAQSIKKKQGPYRELAKALGADGETALVEIAAFLERSNLEQKLKCELGSVKPFLPMRTRYDDQVFEAWAPLGLLAHIAPSNAPSVAPLSVLEGLLSGNVNILKISASDGEFPQLFLKALLDHDATGELKHFVIAARFSSSKKEWMQQILGVADGIAAWGGEEAVASIRGLANPAARLIEWGHKISLIYATRSKAADPAFLEQAAREICLFEQQACSSPQCAYLDTEDWAELDRFAKGLAAALARVSPTMPRSEPSRGEQAEITLVTELERQESCIGKATVIEGPAREWRVLVDARPGLAASPLYRTIWVKPLPRARIIETLRPMRTYLQTAGLACELTDVAELSDLLIRSGAVRVRRVGEMTGSYSGEAHDGVYALSRYCRRISLQLGPEAVGIASFADLRVASAPRWEHTPKIMTKSDFQELSETTEHAHLYFKSGGSSGDPKLSVFTYDDYHAQMGIGAEGLYAAGLDPLTDRGMNLFFSGQLYGGFLSIFSVLEQLGAVQFPMAAQMDFPMVAEAIVRNKVTVLLGMPSYIIQLFEKCSDQLSRYRGVTKVFYGGEHFNDAQRRYLRENFGVKIIKSVGYGSVDTGPLAYQCTHCEGGVHHLHQRLQYLEIIKIDEDAPVAGEEIGRLIFTSRQRKGQKLERYELGDVGHWVKDPCPCGRASPRFKLLGRAGDVMRVGSAFINYQKIVTILSEQLNYSGPVQLDLGHEGLVEQMTVRLSSEAGLDTAKARQTLLDNYDDLSEVVVDEKLLKLELTTAPGESFERVKSSGKLVRIRDRRSR